MTPEKDSSFVTFLQPYLSVRHRGRSSTVFSAEIHKEEHLGKDFVSLTLNGTSEKSSVHDTLIGGEMHNMQLLSKALSESMPRTFLFGENDYCILNELPNGSLLVCMKEAGVEAMEEFWEVGFILDAMPIAELSIIPLLNDRPSGLKGTAIGINYMKKGKATSKETRLWMLPSGSKDKSIEILVRNRWAIFEKII